MATLELVVAALAGGVAGLLVAAIFDPHGQLDPLFFVGGALVGASINRALLH